MIDLIKQLKRLARKAHVEFIERPNGHIQLKGALLVNYYPNSKKKVAYVNGTKHKLVNVTPKQAIKMCNTAPPYQNGKVKRNRNNIRRKRRNMIAKGVTKCHWCGTPITLDTSTIEHVIPLARGGLDNANNRTLACEPCNGKRGDNMPELEKPE